MDDELKRLRAENARLRKELDRLHNFSPTPKQINALPMKLRDYIHRLSTITDPAGDQATIVCLRENVAALAKMVKELQER